MPAVPPAFLLRPRAGGSYEGQVAGAGCGAVWRVRTISPLGSIHARYQPFAGDAGRVPLYA
jgi:hypothetical protein